MGRPARRRLGITEPAIGITEPAVGSSAPAIGITEPTVDIAEPAVGIAEPTIGIAEQIVRSEMQEAHSHRRLNGEPTHEIESVPLFDIRSTRAPGGGAPDSG